MSQVLTGRYCSWRPEILVTRSRPEKSTPDGRCGYTWPEDFSYDDPPNQQNSCYRKSLSDASRCAWHAKPNKTSEKTGSKLEKVRETDHNQQMNGDPRELLDGARLSNFDYPSYIELKSVSLRDSNFYNSNFEKAELSNADLEDANFSKANFQNSKLPDANLSGAVLRRADFEGADLAQANLRGASLVGTNLSDSILPAANLRNTNLTEVMLSGAIFSRNTKISDPSKRIKENLEDSSGVSKASMYDFIARANHELQTAFSNSGLVKRARTHRYKVRKARRREAFLTPGSRGTMEWIGSQVFRFFTGYGVRLRWVLFLMSALWLVSAGVYNYEGKEIADSLYYSVVTFTTSPPSPPETELSRLVAGIETFAGTAAIVFLGYVLGTRERV